MFDKLPMIALATMLGAYALSAPAQAAKPAKPLDLDAAPAPESGAPDPLAPTDVDRPAPMAPGAPAPSAGTPAAAAAVDPIVTQVKDRLAAHPAPRSQGDREDLAAAVAFYASASGQLIWTTKDGLSARGKQAIEEIGKADDWGLKASAFELPALPETAPPAEALVDAEAKLSLAVLKYARQARGGRLDPGSISRKFDQKPVIFDPKSVLVGIASAPAADAYLRELHPKHVQFQRLREALVAARVAKAGEGSPAKASVQQIVANMERWRWMPPELGPFYVMDNIPEQMTYVVDGGKVVLSEKIVVGKLSTPTPIFSAGMQFVIFHPSWGVPPGMKSNELAPQLRDTGGGWFSTKPLASAVLRSHGLQVTRGGVPIDPDAVDWSSVDIRNFDFTQGPGPTNVLGIVKFRFPNKHDVYMHDTPERHLFGGAMRAFSHGCMRVQNPIHLAEVLLAHDKSMSTDQVKDYVRRGGEVKLTTQIPVHVTYFTVMVDDAGALNVRPDIYGLDSRVVSALEGREVSVPSAKLAAAAVEAPVQTAAGGQAGTRQKPRQKRRGNEVPTAAAPPPFNPFSSFQRN